MKLSQYLNNNRAQHLPISVRGREVDDVYFRRLSAGEGLQLKEAFAEMIRDAGDVLGDLAEGDVGAVEERAKERLTSDQLAKLFELQALFTFLHLSDKDGNRLYSDRAEFNREIPDEFIESFYQAGSELKQEGTKDAEKN